MTNIFQQVIARGGYDLDKILHRIDQYHIEGKLSDEEREHLIAAARGDAVPALDTSAEVQRLTKAVRDLTARVDTLEGKAATGGDDAAADVQDYSQPVGAHDAYFAGDVVRYAGTVYRCVAPEGVACVWSPALLPGYWEPVE